MFNYNNLSDIEFEELCKDIMERKLSMKLRIYTSGRDRGIDLSDYKIPHQTIIQIKHYMNSTYSSLKTSLNKEVEKVIELNPKNYYICVSKALTAANTEEIYEMFDEYMHSISNIIDLKEINSILKDENNLDILRKHYKLWLHSTGILSEIYNQNIFIDCEALLSNIDTEKNYFVQTNIYDTCFKRLMRDRIIFVTGAPGVGKTITSKMLLLECASQGYKVKYTTNANLTDVKRSLSTDRSAKEVILLDDCLGQHYFKMNESKESEILSLINYVQMNPNKKLIMNSRITIFNEARGRSIEFNKFFYRRTNLNYLIDMSKMHQIDKAKIFYSHLYFNNIPVSHFKELRKDKRYKTIVEHKNYTPRIIEFISEPHVFKEINATEYYPYIMHSLNTPDSLWKDEFDYKLNSIDRIFMYILYSLTETIIPVKIMKECFEERLLLEVNLDTTINNFDSIVSRLNNSMITFFDAEGEQNIGVSNPSVNDFLKPRFESNNNEKNKIRKSLVYFEQLQRCYKKERHANELVKMIRNHSIKGLKSESKGLIQSLIIYTISEENILDPFYIEEMHDYLLHSPYKLFSRFGSSNISLVLYYFKNKDAFNIYKIKDILYSIEKIELLLEDILDFEILADAIIALHDLISIYGIEIDNQHFLEIIEDALQNTIEHLASNLDIDEFHIEIDSIIENSLDIDGNIVNSELSQEILDMLDNEFFSRTISYDLERIALIIDINSEKIIRDYSESINIDVDDIIQSYFDSLYEPYDEDEPRYSNDNFDDIESIFEREMN
jgi:hypothetical protein